MNVKSRGSSGNQQFYNTLTTDKCISQLEVPDGKIANRNAWLTITINYRLNFLDSKNLGTPRPVVFLDKISGKFMAYDSDKTIPAKAENALPSVVYDWDDRSRANFERRFREAAKFWNEKFLLITPPHYGGLDYIVPNMPGWIHRPNVICLYNLDGGGLTEPLIVNVVRTRGSQFRSNSGLLDEGDVRNNTIYHEIGHFTERLHIQGLMGNQACIADNSADECYDEPNLPKGREHNISGNSHLGKGLLPLNAKPWIELIAEHTKTSQPHWKVSMNTQVAPSRMRIADAAKQTWSEKLMPIKF